MQRQQPGADAEALRVAFRWGR